VASAGPYANPHLDPDTATPECKTLEFILSDNVATNSSDLNHVDYKFWQTKNHYQLEEGFVMSTNASTAEV